MTFIIFALISLGCTKADLKFKSLKSDSSSTGTGGNQTAPLGFQVSAGAANLNSGTYSLKAQIKANSAVVLNPGSGNPNNYSLLVEVVR